MVKLESETEGSSVAKTFDFAKDIASDPINNTIPSAMGKYS